MNPLPRQPWFRPWAHLAIAPLLAACGGPADDRLARDDVLIERWAASVGDPVSLDPAHAVYTWPQASIPYAMFDQLMTYDPDSRQIVPMLAERVASNAAATEWTFTLRADALWHDGTPVRASDVKFAWERVAHPRTASRSASQLSLIEGYEAYRAGQAGEIGGIEADDDARTLTVALTTPFADFPGLVTQLPFSPVPAHAVLAVPDRARWDDGLMIGSGPFRMSEPWRHGRRITLAAFDRYYGGAPALGAIEFRVGRDVDSSFAELEAGIAHIAFMPPARYAEISERADLEVIDTPMSATWYLGFNMRDPVVGGPDNAALREAIALAIDRDAIVGAVYQGGRRAGYTLTPPEVAGHDASVAPARARDLKTAKARFAAWGGAARLTRPIRFIYNAGSGQENVAAILQANLADAGIAVETQSFDAAQFAVEIEKPTTMMFRQLITYTFPSPDAGLYPLLHSRAAGTNLTRYANGAVDAALDAARATRDAQARHAFYARAEAIALEDFAIIPVFHYKAAGVTARSLQGVRFMPSGFMDYRAARLAETLPDAAAGRAIDRERWR